MGRSLHSQGLRSRYWLAYANSTGMVSVPRGENWFFQGQGKEKKRKKKKRKEKGRKNEKERERQKENSFF